MTEAELCVLLNVCTVVGSETTGTAIFDHKPLQAKTGNGRSKSIKDVFSCSVLVC